MVSRTRVETRSWKEFAMVEKIIRGSNGQGLLEMTDSNSESLVEASVNQALSPVLKFGQLSEGEDAFPVTPASRSRTQGTTSLKDLYIRNIQKERIQMLSSQREPSYLRMTREV